MKAFHFQQFSIKQSQEVFRVGTDGVLLGVLATCENVRNILEVGTGTGLISLMLAQRNIDAHILALDVNKKAVELAKENFSKSPFSERLEVIHQDFRIFESRSKLDFIICNPPYFKKMERSQKDVLARQQVELNFVQLIEKSVQCLTNNGRFSVVIPKNSNEFFCQKCEEFGLYLHRRVNIRGNIQGEIKRCVLEFNFERKDFCEEELIVEIAPRKYSPRYVALTRDFHIFKQKNQPF